MIDSDTGIIKNITKTTQLSEKADSDLILKYPNRAMALPGMIDVHVHFRDLNQKHKETIASGSQAAAAGGVTTAFDMPNKEPPITDKNNLRSLEKLISRDACIEVHPYLQLTAENSLTLEKYQWIKIYFGHTFGASEINETVIEEAFKTALLQLSSLTTENVTFTVHCEDPQLLVNKSQIIIENWDDFLKTNPTKLNEWRPKKAEVSAIKKIIMLIFNDKKIEKECSVPPSSKLKVHIAHLSTKEGLHIFLEAKEMQSKKNSISLSAEVTPHHLWFDQNSLKKLGVLGKVNPPLRMKSDVTSLRLALKNGQIPVVATDHAPHLLEEKKESAPSGMPGIETALPSLITLHRKGLLRMEQIVEVYSTNPARLMGIHQLGRGNISKGGVANLVIVDPKEEWKVRNDDIISKCGWTPFDGEILHGRPLITFCKGKIVFER